MVLWTKILRIFLALLGRLQLVTTELSTPPWYKTEMAEGTSEAQLKPHTCNSLKESVHMRPIVVEKKQAENGKDERVISEEIHGKEIPPGGGVLEQSTRWSL